jgi:hypothetical protein
MCGEGSSPSSELFIDCNNLRKGLHLEGFDPSWYMIDPELRWIYAG